MDDLEQYKHQIGKFMKLVEINYLFWITKETTLKKHKRWDIISYLTIQLVIFKTFKWSVIIECTYNREQFERFTMIFFLKGGGCLSSRDYKDNKFVCILP